MRHACNLVRLCALSLVVLALAGCTVRPTRPALQRSGAKRLDIKQAQAAVDFVICAPTFLPAGVRVGKALVIPEQMVGPYLLPNEVMLDLGAGLSVWEMPDGAVGLAGPAVPVGEVGREKHTGWLSAAGGLGRATLEWQDAGTRIGLSGTVGRNLLLRIADSFKPAHPEVAPRPVSARRARMAPGLARPVLPLPPLPPGGIGANMAQGPPILVAFVYPGLPADRAGIKQGDELTAVDGRTVNGGPAEDSVRLVRGPIGTRVTLTMRPKGETRLRTVTLVRAAVPMLHHTPMSMRQAQAAVAYPLLAPSYLPPGFRLTEFLLDTWKPNPGHFQPEAQASYDGPFRALISISQRAATATWPPWDLPPGSVPVTAGSFQATIGRWPSGDVVVQWRAGPTAVRLYALGIGPRRALRVAVSMGPAK